jgi:CheY-like chemotaxis protein
MLTHVINMSGPTVRRRQSESSQAVAQKVVIVNGGKEVLGLFETVLDAGRYDVVFVETAAHAYSQIRRVQPDLVILCLKMDDPAGFRVLSMLKLDPETSSIPVLTCTADEEDSELVTEDADEQEADMSADDMLLSRTLLRMN